MTGVQLRTFGDRPLEGPLELGQRVTFKATLTRTSLARELAGPWRKAWRRHGRLAMAGIIVGRRTLSDGVLELGYDEPTVYHPERHFTAYLVAYDLNRKPVHVLPEDLYPPPVTVTREQLEQSPATLPGVHA